MGVILLAKFLWLFGHKILTSKCICISVEHHKNPQWVEFLSQKGAICNSLPVWTLGWLIWSIWGQFFSMLHRRRTLRSASGWLRTSAPRWPSRCASCMVARCLLRLCLSGSVQIAFHFCKVVFFCQSRSSCYGGAFFRLALKICLSGTQKICSQFCPSVTNSKALL